MKYLILVLGLALTWVFPITAQDEGCTIEFGGIEALLEEAQTAAREGDTETALALLADVRTAVEEIESACEALLPIALEESFYHISVGMGFDYPADWVIGEYNSLGANGSIVFLGSSEDALDSIPDGSDFPEVQPGDQLLAIFSGSSSALIGERVEVDSLEGTFEALIETLKEEYSGVSAIEYFTLNDRRAGTFEFSDDTFHATMTLVEYQRGETYALLMGIAAPEEIDLLRPIVYAIAETLYLGV